jgi:predicted membrane protein
VKALRGLLGIALPVIAVYLLWQVLPPYIHNYQFQDSVEEIARFGGLDYRTTDEDIRQKVLKSAQDLKIPISAEDINVARSNQEVVVWVDYTVHINVPVHPFDLEFHPATKNKR